MARRCLAFVLALSVAGAPIALEACQLACAWATAEAQSSGAHQTHACHHEAPPDAATMTPAPHACGHTDELPASPSVAIAQGSSGAPFVALVVAVAPPANPLAMATGSIVQAPHSPGHPDPHLAVPLRL